MIISEEKYDQKNNVLKNAPHTIASIVDDNWDYPYSREKAAFPLKWIKDNKFWPSVRRINEVQGDRNLICSCASIESYEEKNETTPS